MLRTGALVTAGWLLTAAVFLLAGTAANAGVVAAPGDLRLRHDLQLLDDSGLINRPLTTWPLAWGDLVDALDDIDVSTLGIPQQLAYERLRREASLAMGNGRVEVKFGLGVAKTPRVIRGFEDTPRDDGQLSAGIEWTGNRFAYNLSAEAVASPSDGDEVRPDDSFVGMAVGNWMLTAGWQPRWWGPGRDGSLILSTNARPLPAIALQRNRSVRFESRWLRWAGPWTLVSFMGKLDDERVIDNALLFGIRAAFRPHPSLEVGLTRTAQWCGQDRPCDGSAFVDLLLGKDNRGVNVADEEEPGNQLAGIDMRWALPAGIPLAVYLQWVGEDSRRGGPEIGSWLRQLGLEYHGYWRGIAHRSHLEVSETSCRDGGAGFSALAPDCAYEHSIYRSGYRYNNRSLGHGIDSDGLAYSLGSTLVQSDGSTWSLNLRFMEINKVGSLSRAHSLSLTPQDRFDVQFSHVRVTNWGRFNAGLGYSNIDGQLANGSETEVTGFIQWNSL